MPILASIVSVTATVARTSATSGGIKFGLRAMSAKVADGETKTPRNRSRKDFEGGISAVAADDRGVSITLPSSILVVLASNPVRAQMRSIMQHNSMQGAKQAHARKPKGADVVISELSIVLKRIDLVVAPAGPTNLAARYLS
jgi:hypothetical protein